MCLLAQKATAENGPSGLAQDTFSAAAEGRQRMTAVAANQFCNTYYTTIFNFGIKKGALRENSRLPPIPDPSPL